MSACDTKSHELSHTARTTFCGSYAPYVAQCPVQSLVAALVLTKLDFGNATLAGIPAFQLDRLLSRQS